MSTFLRGYMVYRSVNQCQFYARIVSINYYWYTLNRMQMHAMLLNSI